MCFPSLCFIAIANSISHTFFVLLNNKSLRAQISLLDMGSCPFFFVSVLLDFYFFLFIMWDFMSKFCASSLTTLLYFVAALFSEDGES